MQAIRCILFLHSYFFSGIPRVLSEEGFLTSLFSLTAISTLKTFWIFDRQRRTGIGITKIANQEDMAKRVMLHVWRGLGFEYVSRNI